MINVGDGMVTHPSCDFMASERPATVTDPVALALKAELTEIIQWAQRTSPRSLQLAVGPSELGNPCDRRLAYRVAGYPTVNTGMDPWPSIVGTSIHSWTESAVKRFMDETGVHDWLTEVRLEPDPMVPGSSDLYKISEAMVVDLKTAGTEVFRRVKKDGPSEGYKIQTHLYGLGHERAGRPVRKVALVVVPRAGWLKDMYVWCAPYERAVAENAVARVYSLGAQLLELDILNNDHRFQDFEASPGDACVWCPFFLRHAEPDETASGFGCPGR